MKRFYIPVQKTTSWKKGKAQKVQAPMWLKGLISCSGNRAYMLTIGWWGSWWFTVIYSWILTTAARISSRLTDLSDPARALRLDNPVTFKSLNRFRKSWHGSISNIWNTLPAHLLLEGHATGWCSIFKSLQCFCNWWHLFFYMHIVFVCVVSYVYDEVIK